MDESTPSYCCRKCFVMTSTGMQRLFRDRMLLCPECGNKRCPKASDHDLACTGSNESGQPGSAYK